MAGFRSSRSRSSTSRSWLTSVLRFRRHFPKLLRGDFWRSETSESLWNSLFRRKKKHAEKRRSARRGSVSGWSAAPIAFQPEALEVRAMLSLNAGSLDTTFHTTGLATNTVSGAASGRAVAVASNGDIIVAGNSASKFAFAVYDSSGALQNTYAFTVGAGVSQANAIAFDSSGRLVVAGYASGAANEDFAVARYNFVAGSHSLALDSSFGTSGIVTTDIGGFGGHDFANAVSIDSGGRIIVAGQSDLNLGGNHAVVARFTTAGVLDSTFGLSGTLIYTPTSDVANGVAISGSTIVVAGTNSASGAEIFTAPDDGSLSTLTQFGLSLGGGSTATSVIINSVNGEYLVAGASSTSKFLLAEVKTDGTLDTAFGTSGKTETAIGTNSQATGIAQQSNGKIDLAGTTTTGIRQNFAVARFSSNGILDSAAFGSPNGFVMTDFSGNNSANSSASALAIQPDGQIVVAGTESVAPSRMAVARYVANNVPTAANSSVGFTSIDEGQTNNSGDTVASLASQLGFTDVDGDSVGIAVTGVDNSHGVWQYSTNSGSSWAPIPAVSDSSALLLSTAAGNRIRLVPDGTAETSSPITIRGWDRTKGNDGDTSFNITANQAANYNSFSDNSFTATAQITEPAIVASTTSLAAINEGDASAPVTVATFTHANGIEAPGHFTATVDWNDGNGAVSATVTQPGGAGTGYVVTSTRPVYAEEGTHTVTVSISEDNVVASPVIDSQVVNEAAVNAIAANLAAVDEGAAATPSVTVATFTHANGVEAPGHFTATVNWGISGHAADPAVVTQPGGPGTGYVVTATRPVYDEEGTFGVTTSITDDAAGTTTVFKALQVNEVAVVATGGQTLSGSEGGVVSGTVATFTDPAGAEAPSRYSATIDWGDGNSELVAVTTYGVVSGTHTYAEESGAEHSGSNPYTITVTVHHVNQFGTHSNVVTSTATIGEVAVVASGSQTLIGSEGASVSGTVATFTDPAGAESPSDYTATIDWGDGSTPQVVAITTYGVVSGTHIYAEESAGDHAGSNPYTISVTVHHEGTDSNAVTSTATIGEVAVVATGGQTLTGSEGASVSGTVATFTDPAGAESPSDYTATINWGDGSAPQVVAVTTDGVVSGTHTYAEERAGDHAGSNPYTISVTVHHEGTDSNAVTSTATIAEVAVTAVGHDISVITNESFSNVVVASFSDPAGPENPNTDYATTIDWGDMSSSAGTVVSDGSGGFLVVGSHTYTTTDTYDITTTINHEGQISTASSQATAANVDYVDDVWNTIYDSDDPSHTGAPEAGDTVEAPQHPGVYYTYGVNAFSTVQAGVTAIQTGGIVNVFAGSYGENLTIGKALSLRGAQYGVDARTRSGDESIIQSPSATDAQIDVTASGVTIDGFTIDGSDVATRAIRFNGTDNDVVSNNIITGAVRGVQYNGDVGGNTGGRVENNLIESLSTSDTSYGVLAFDSSYVQVTDNTMSGLDAGIFEQYFYQANVGDATNVIGGNDITANLLGYGTNERGSGASTTDLSGNTFTLSGEPGSVGVQLYNIYKSGGVTLHNNAIVDADVGVYAFINGGSVSITGGSISGGGSIGVQLTNYLADFTTAAIADGSLSISGTQISDYETGVLVDDNPSGANAVSADINSDTEITGGTTGILITGAHASATIDDVTIDPPTTGISIVGGTATITGSNITSDGDGIDVTDGTATILGTTINANAQGIATYGASTVQIGDGTNPNANQIEGQIIGVALYGGTATIDDNTIDSSGGTGVQLLDTDPVSATIEHNTISGLGGGIAVIGSGASAMIDHNTIENVGTGSDASPAVAVLLQNDGYASVEDNTIQNVDIGIEIDGFDAPDGSSLHMISGNDIIYAVHGVVISNLSDDATAFDVSGNTITSQQNPGVVNDGEDVGLMLLSINNDDGVTPGVTLTNNTISGAEIGVYAFDDGTPLTITGGTIEHSHFPFGPSDLGNGVLLVNSDPFLGSSSVDESVTLDGVSLLDNALQVAVLDESNFDPSATGSVSVGLTGGTTITGGGVGLNVDGPNAFVDGGTVNDTTFTGQSDSYIQLFDGAMAGLTLDATGAIFDGFQPGSAAVNALTLPTFFSIEDKINDYLDESTEGYVKLKAGFDFLAHSSESQIPSTSNHASPGSLQRAVDASTGGDTVYVQAGSYVGGAAISKSLTLLGANAAADPTHGGARGAESVIMPGVSGADPYSGTHTFLIEVLSSGVTIKGFKLTGQNTALADANGVLLTQTGSPIYAQAVEGIVGYDPTGTSDISANSSFPGTSNPSNITIENNIIEDLSYMGVDMGWGTTGDPSSDNTISHNLIQNIGAYNDEGDAVRLYNNFYADVTDNQILNTRMGVETGNFYQPNPGSTGSIENNEIQVRRRGVFYNLFYNTASALPVSHNTITATADDPAIVAGASLWTGVYIISQNGTSTGVFLDNSIDGTGSSYSTTAGYTLLNTWASDGVTIGGDASPLNSISGVSYGIWETSGDPNGFGAGTTQDMGVTISGLDISASQVGVYVQVDPSNPSHIVDATINGGTISTATSASGVGVLVSGTNASATISGVTIDDPLYGVEINGGSASVTGATIQNNGTGVYVHGGGSASLSNDQINSNNIGIQVGDGSAAGGTVIATLNNLMGNTTGIKVDAATLLSAVNNLITGGAGDSVDVTAAGTPSVILTGNELGNSGLGVNNANAATVDASLNYWGAVGMTESAVSAKTLGPVDYTPWLDNGSNSVAIGFSGDVSKLDVGSSGQQVQTGGRINEAIGDSAGSGILIQVYPGTYVEQVLIGKDLTLHGISEAGTIIQSPATLATNFTTSGPNKAVVYVNNATANINNLTIDGNKQGDANNRIVGLAYYDASGIADHLTIENVSNNPLNGVQAGTAFLAFSDVVGPNTVTLSNSDLFGYQKNGVTASGAGLTANIIGNTVTGAGPTTLIAQNGIQLSFGAAGTIQNNIVSGNSYIGSQPADSAGILLFQPASGTLVSGNQVSGSDLGIYALDAGSVVIDANTVTGSASVGIGVDGTSAVVSNNTVQNGVGNGGPANNTGDGIDLFGDVTGTTIHNNFIQNNTGTGIYIDSGVTDTSAPLPIHDNSITGNVTAGIDNESGVTADATSNWWGTANGPTTPANTFNVGSQGDKIVGPGTTNFVPWLNDGTDTQPLVAGFQPNATTFAPVTVTETGDQFSSIQAAIDDPTTVSGDHIVLAAGTFTENVDVTKSLTITGAGQGLTTVYSATSNPLGTGGGSLNGGSVIFLVDANNVTLQGLTVDGDTPGLTSAINVGGANIDARDGIITDHPAGVFNNLNVNHVTVQNIYLRGIYASSGGSFDFEHDTVTNVQADSQSIGMFNFGGSGTMAFNNVSYANDAISANHSTGTQFHDNVITHSLSGIHTDNMGDGGGTPDAIYNNNILLGGAGSYGIFVFVPYLNVSVHDNVISGVDVGLAAFGGQGGAANFANDTVSVNAGCDGAIVSTDTFGFAQMNVAASFSGDSFSGYNGGGTGILVQQNAGATATATISGVTVNDPTYGIDINGGTASISGSTIKNNDVGIIVHNGGSATISNNFISANGTGIEFTDTGNGSVTGNDFTGATDNGTDLLLTSTAGTLSALTGNAFAGDTYFIDDQSTQNLDVTSGTGNTFDESNNFRIEDKMHHRMDTDLPITNGLITWVAGNLYVTTPGSHSTGSPDTDSNIQRGVDAASAGNIVNVEAGTFLAGATVNTSLTIRGAGWGIDARSRAIAESIINNSGGAFGIHTANVTIDGFTLSGQSNDNSGPGFGYAIYMAPGVGGTQVLNDIVTGNHAGIAVSNVGATPATIEQNLFKDNSSGLATDIYADQFTAGVGGVQNVLIQNNDFTNTSFVEDAWGIGISNTDTTPFSNITVRGNTFSNAGRGMYFFNSTGVSIDANTVTGATHYAVGLFGDVNTNFDIGRNTLNGNKDGIDIIDELAGNVDVTGLNIHNNFIDGNSGKGISIDSTATVSSGGIAININHIAGNSVAGLENDSSVNVNADSNWWGSASGPTNVANPAGTGDKIIGSNVTFSPWLADGIDSDPPQPGFQHAATPAAVSISGPSTNTEGVVYVLNLSPSADINSWDITWGDGQMTHVVGSPASVNHIFEEGGFNISAVAHTTSSGDVASNTVHVSVTDAALSENSFSPPAATEGAPFSGTVFNFSDADPNGTASDYTAVIALGDGSSVTLTSTPSANGQIVAHGDGTFDVNLSHTYLEELSAQTFSVTVYDNGDGRTIADPSDSVVSASTSHFTVADAALTAGALTPPGATEGAHFTDVQLFHFTDADSNAVASDYTATITWGDGTTSIVTSTHSANGQIVGNFASGFDVIGSHTYLEEATGLTFEVSVTDHSSLPISASAPINVADAALATNSFTPPVATEGTPFSGTVLNFGDADPNGTASDYTATVMLGDGSTVVLTSTLSADGQIVAHGDGTFDVNASHTYSEDFSGQTFSVSVIDHNSTTSQSTNTFSVAEAAMIGSSVTLASVSEGDASATVEVATFTHANGIEPANHFSATVDWGQGPVAANAVTQDISGVYHVTAARPVFVEDNTYPVTVVISDNDSLAATTTVHDSLTVTEPSILGSSAALPTINEGDASAVVDVATFTHANCVEAPGHFTAMVNWGLVGHMSDPAVVTQVGNVYHVTATRPVYSEESPGYTVVVLIVEDNGSTLVNDSQAVLEPAINGSSTALVGISEGDAAASIQVATFTHANGIEPATDFTAMVNWGIAGHGADPATVSQPGGPGTQYVVTANRPVYSEEGTYAVSVSITEDSGANSTVIGDTQMVSEPTIIGSSTTLPAIIQGDASTSETVATFTHANGVEPFGGFTATVDWGIAGHNADPATISQPGGPGTGYTVTATRPVYNAPGNYTVTVTISEDHASTMVVDTQVVAATFQVTSFSGNSSGFDATFNRAADTTKLNLYRGSTLSGPFDLGVADVTVVGQHVGAVRGSLIWDATTNTAHFVATGGLLAPDTYTVTLASRSDGWTDANGSLLDGLNNGHAGSGNYTHNFVVAAPTVPVISMPDFARGPGQALDVNADGTARTTMLPVHIGNVTGVRSVDFEIDYDPSLLTITSATFAAGWTGIENMPHPGQILVTVFRPVANSSSPIDIVDFTGSIPMAAPYGAAQLLNIINIPGNHGIINEGNIGVVVDEAVQKIAYFGDATGDATLSGLDATLISRNAVHLDDGFTAYPLTDPRIIGDVSGDGTLSGFDASQVANVVVHHVEPTIPAIPAHGVLSMSSLDPTVTIPLGVLADPGQMVNIPVTITDNAAGLLAADLEINYANSGISLSDASVTLSSYLMSRGWGFAENVDDSTGVVFISEYSTSNGALPAGMPQILNLQFQVPTNAAPGEYAITTSPAPDSRLNEGHLALTVQNGSIIVVDPLNVLNTNDDGVGSLRQVINYANGLPGAMHTITFAIPAGPQTINLLTPLPASTVPLAVQLDASQNVVIVSPTGGGQDNYSALTKVGSGSLTIAGDNNLTGNVQIDAGTLRFNVSTAPTLPAGFSPTVDGTGTLELAGSVSALTGGSGGNDITNNSNAAAGVLVSGTNQFAGGIDGTGTTAIGDGGQLTANHIVQGALVIGGSAGNFATLTIAASDASGHPLSAAPGSANPSSAAVLAESGGAALGAPAITLSTVTNVSEGATVPAVSDTVAGVAASPTASEAVTLARPVSFVASGPSSPSQSAVSRPSERVVAISGLTYAARVGTDWSNSATAQATASSQDAASTVGQSAVPKSAGRSLDPDAVAAAFDDSDISEWLGSSRGLRSSTDAAGNLVSDTAVGGDASLLADELLNAIGQGWQV